MSPLIQWHHFPSVAECICRCAGCSTGRSASACVSLALSSSHGSTRRRARCPRCDTRLSVGSGSRSKPAIGERGPAIVAARRNFDAPSAMPAGSANGRLCFRRSLMCSMRHVLGLVPSCQVTSSNERRSERRARSRLGSNFGIQPVPQGRRGLGLSRHSRQRRRSTGFNKKRRRGPGQPGNKARRFGDQLRRSAWRCWR